MKDKKLRKSFQDKPCVVCGTVGCDPDHIQTYAVTLTDNNLNMWPLCRKHHDEKGKGTISFVKKYGLESELKKRGFVQNPGKGNWFIPHEEVENGSYT